MNGDSFLLPGRSANLGKSHLGAAVHELREESGLQAYRAMFLFSFQSRKNDHKVYWVQTLVPNALLKT